MSNQEQQLQITSRGAEVWAPQKTVEGICNCFVDGCDLYLEVNGRQDPVIVMGNQFSALAHLQEGENTIVARCIHPDGKSFESNTIVHNLRIADRPKARIELAVADGRIVIDGSKSERSEVSGAAVYDYKWTVGTENPSTLLMPLHGERVSAVVPAVDGEYYVYLTVTDTNQRTDRAGVFFNVVNGYPHLIDKRTENARWIEEAVVYGVIPHNFGPEGFRDVTARLDYLKELGINAIWLAPSNHTPNVGGHSYNVTNYFEVRADYGTKEDLRELVNEAHSRGIRVLMDFVPNHTAIEHRYMQDLLQNSDMSPYYDFYVLDQQGKPTHYFDWDNLPNLNFDNPEVFRWIKEALCYWVRELDVDGYRVDVAWGIKQRRPDFWPELRQELQRIKPDVCLLAEASARDPYYYTEGFDCAYDWTEELGHWSMEKVFVDKKEIVYKLRNALTNYDRGFPEDALVFRFLNNNDTAQRFITRYGKDVTQVAAAMLLTLPGMPCVYTGDETGAEFEPYQTADPISFDDVAGLREYYRTLIRLRKEHPALRTRLWEEVSVPEKSNIFAYVRFGRGGEQSVLVVLNYSPDVAELKIDIPSCFGECLPSTLSDVLNGDTVSLKDGRIEVTLEPWSARVLTV